MVNKETLLNTRQKQILAYIREKLHASGYPPSVREICSAVGLSSTSTVHGHLAKLENLGFIRRDPTKPRAIDILDEAPWRQKKMYPLPLIGEVRAGSPILAEEHVEEVYPFSADLVGSENCFMLRVIGDSMIDAGIYAGDKLIIRIQNTANNGEIVVALLDEEATVKRFYREADRVRLQPANDAYKPIYTTDCQILGKVIGLYRTI